jgi:ribose transport system permease protein
MLQLILRNQLLAILVAVFLVFSFSSEYFTSPLNLMTLGREGAEVGIICLAVTLILIIGRLDISVGAVMAVSALIMIIGYKAFSIHWGYLIPACLAFGLVIGLINGALVSLVGVPSFIATLGMLIILRGIMQWAAATEEMRAANSIFSDDPVFQFIGGGDVGGVIPLSVVILLVLLGATLWLLKATRLGVAIYAFGGNFQAAMRAGLRVRLIEIGVFTLSGLCASIAGILLASRLDSVTYQTGQFLEFHVLIAVILGGTSIAGGVGSVWGTVLGVGLIAMLSNGMVMLAMDRDLQDIIVALFLLFALFMDKVMHRFSGRATPWRIADLGLIRRWARPPTGGSAGG